MRLSHLPLLLLPLLPAALGAQHSYNPNGQFDPSVPVTTSVLGHAIGDRFTPHHLIVRYAERLAATSRRIRVDTVARTFEGRESIMIVATSEANHGRMAQIRADARRIGDPRGASPADVA